MFFLVRDKVFSLFICSKKAVERIVQFWGAHKVVRFVSSGNVSILSNSMFCRQCGNVVILMMRVVILP